MTCQKGDKQMFQKLVGEDEECSTAGTRTAAKFIQCLHPIEEHYRRIVGTTLEKLLTLIGDY